MRVRPLGRPPLAGVRIADLTHVWAGPKCTQLLADLGAEVIKVESPSRTDPARGSATLLGLERYPNRQRGPNPYDRNGYFNTTGRNKYGITLDLRSARGSDLFKQLVAVSDVVVENFSAGVMDRLGLGYEILKAVQPGIILVALSGFGATGPESRTPAWAETVEAMAGLPALTGYPDGPPMLTFQGISDPVGGMFGAAAVLTALHHRHRTGEGQFIDLSQQESLLSLTAEPLLDYALNQRVRPRLGNRHPAMAPHGIFPCREPDSWVAIVVPDDAAWARLCAVEGSPAAWTDARFGTLPGRLAHRAEIESLMAEWTRGLTHREVTAKLQAVGVPGGPTMHVADIAADAHVKMRGLLRYIDHEEVGPYPYYVSAPVRYGSEVLAPHRCAPRFGADNREVLSRILGLSDDEIAQLETDHVIASRPQEAVLAG